MNYRIRLHPRVAGDLEAIATWILEFAGPDSAERKLDDIRQVIRGLSALPHKGTRRDDIAPGLRAIPAGRKAVIAFIVDDAAAEVLIYAVSYAGKDWATDFRGRA